MRKRSHRLTADWVDAWVIEFRPQSAMPASRKRLTDTLVPPVLRTYFASCDQDFRLTRDSHGRPVCPEIELNFNLAHSRSLAVVAVGLRDKLGLDVEKIETEGVDLDGLVREHFSDLEAKAYFDAPESGRARTFFHIWTQKEAVTKAIGTGMKQDLREVVVETNPDKGCRLIALNGQPGDGWTLRNIFVGDDHYAVVAAFGPSFLVNLRGPSAQAEEFAI